MAVITASGLYIFRNLTPSTVPATVGFLWPNRLAGTAYVDSAIMTGFVIALSLSGPSVVGVADIKADGTWEILGIAQNHAYDECIVLGISRNTSNNYAVASKIHPVM